MYPMVCINTYEREDRYRRCQQLFEQQNWDVKFHRTHRSKDDPVKACYEAHRTIAQQHPQGVIIFEDDIILTKEYSLEKFNHAYTQALTLIEHGQCDIFYFGCVPQIWKYGTQHIKDNLFRVNAACTHAYLLSPNAAQALGQTPYQNIPVDVWWNVEQFKTIAYLPSLIDQGIFGSDIGLNTSTQWFTNSEIRTYIHNFSNYYPYYCSYSARDTIIVMIVLLIIIIAILIYIYVR